MADLIAACMEADPADRPSAKDVVEMLSQQVEKPVAGSRRSARKEVRPPLQPVGSFRFRHRYSHRYPRPAQAAAG